MQRRLLVQSGAWLLATSASVTLTWFGVHTVVSGTAYDPPPALPVSDRLNSPSPPRASSTHRPKPPPEPSVSSSAPETGRATKSPSRPATSQAGSPEPGTPGPSTSRTPPETDSPPPSGSLQGATVAGGRVVFDVGSQSAELVSATPEPGWDMQVWKTPTWIRVTFSTGQSASSVICRWEEPPPRIETFEN